MAYHAIVPLLLAALVDAVDPLIGTSSGHNGHAFPGAACPHGLVQVSPDTGTGDWAHCAGYQYEDPDILGFSHQHFCGTGGADLGDVLLLPFTGNLGVAHGKKDFATETASPGYYAVDLTNFNIRAEVTATPRTALHRWTASEGRRIRVLVDLQHGIVRYPHLLTNRVIFAESHFTADGRGLVGTTQVKAWLTRTLHFALVFSRPIEAKVVLQPRQGEKGARYVLDFGLDDGSPMMAKVGLSRTSQAAAVRNLAAECPDWDFSGVREGARSRWERELHRMELAGVTREQRTVFYSALYRLFLQPNDLSDVGEDPEFSGHSFWDTFRAAFPLRTILAPEMMPDIVASLLRQSRRQGFLPVMPFADCDACSMIGNHAVPVTVDAYLKGVAGDVDGRALLSVVTNSLGVLHPGKPKEDWPLLDSYGYYPFDKVPNQSVSRTLEAQYDDACAARLARALGETEVAVRFERRAAGWTNLFDRSELLMRAKDSSGRWRHPFDPFRTGYVENDFTEGNSWQYTWHVLQDIPGLIAAFGGEKVFVSRLDRLFLLPENVAGSGVIRDATGAIGQYVHGNEPDHHAAYLFAVAGRPEKTRRLVREIASRFYTIGPDGLCGNEDCGQMSAWYLFACLGFYPVDPCGGAYVLGAPQASEVCVRLPQGRVLIVRRTGDLESSECVVVRLNGRSLGPIVRHEDLLRGGELVFAAETDVNHKPKGEKQ